MQWPYSENSSIIWYYVEFIEKRIGNMFQILIHISDWHSFLSIVKTRNIPQNYKFNSICKVTHLSSNSIHFLLIKKILSKSMTLEFWKRLFRQKYLHTSQNITLFPDLECQLNFYIPFQVYKTRENSKIWIFLLYNYYYL